MTQAELGSLVGVGKSAVSQYESGAREPETAVLVKMAGLFGVSTDWLLGVDGPADMTVREPRPVYGEPGGDAESRAYLAELSAQVAALQSPEDRHAVLELARFLAQKGSAKPAQPARGTKASPTNRKD